MKQDGQYYWYHNDHLGTPQMMTTSSGAVVWKVKYSSFGKATIDSSSTVVNPLRFPGQYEDNETGLHYNYFRYYYPLIGRYLKIDPLSPSQLLIVWRATLSKLFKQSTATPIKIEKIKQIVLTRLLNRRFLKNPLSLHTIIYVRNNPMNLIDPWGLWDYATEYGTTGAGLTEHMTNIEDAVDQAYTDAGGPNDEATVTFTTNGTHSPNSLHYSGNAVDLRVWGLTDEQRADWAQRIRDAIGDDYDVVDEGDHIHVEYDPCP